MNILILTTHFNTGGISRYVCTLAKGLKEKGVGVVVVSAGGDMISSLIQCGAEHIQMNIRTKSELNLRLYLALGKLTRLIAEKNIDVIHAQTRVTQVMAYFLGHRSGKPVVTTCHGFFKPKWSRKIFPCWGDAVIAISEPVARHLTEDLHVDANKIAAISNGIDVQEFQGVDTATRDRRRQEFGFSREPLIGIIARLSDVKGHDILIRAMKEVSQNMPQAKLLIIGQGKMEQNLKELVGKLGLAQHVRFYPLLNKTAEMLSILDVFVLPSLQEGLGLSVMEAQAAGLPVVASRVGGIPGLIEHGKTGLLVEPRDVQALAAAIIKVLGNRGEAQQMGARAKEFIAKNFSAETMTAKTLALYQRVIHNHE